MTARTTETLVTPDGRRVDARLDTWLLAHDPLLHTNVASAITDGGAQGGAPSFIAELAVKELRRVLPTPLVDLLVNGVKGHDALRAAAVETLRDRSTQVDVVLARRTLHATHTVEVTAIGGIVTPSLEFVVAVDFLVVDARADVSRGRLAALSLSDPVVTGRVYARVDGVPTGDMLPQTATLRLGGLREYRPPLQILSSDEEADATRLLPT
jgi:hypothetical protein